MTKYDSKAPLWIGRFAYLLGLFNILANVFRPFKGAAKRLDHYLPVFINSTGFTTAVFTGFLLILFARGLQRRKRRAWTLTLIALGANLFSDLLRIHRHPFQLIFAILLIAVLLIFKSSFYALSDPTTKFQPIFAFILSFLTFLIIGLLIVYFRHKNEVIGNPSFINTVITVIEGFIGINGPIQFTSSRTQEIVETTLNLLGFFIFLVPVWLFFRRISPIPTTNPADIEIIKTLIKHDSEQDSLGYFATRADKSVIWSENKKAGIAYRVSNGVMLASGDPFGEFSLWPQAIDNFLEEARLHAWTPAVVGASDRGGEVWVEHGGMTAFDIGDEAIIKVADFTLEGRSMRNVRQMVNRITRNGYSTTTLKWHDVDNETKMKLRVLAKNWRYGAQERGFSMALDRFGSDADDQTCITIAWLDGEIKGLLHFVPWSTNGLSLDRMQRDKEADPGLNELMIANTVAWASTHSVENISLNFAAFRSLFERADKLSAGPIVRSQRNVVRFFSNFFQVESLYRFNAKFDPEWQTRYVLYPRSSDIVKVGVAALRAETFFTKPKS